MTFVQALIPNEELRKFISKKAHTLQSLFYHGITDMFYEVEVETITECNLRCAYCPNTKSDRGQSANRHYLSENLFKKIVDELSGIKTPLGRFSPHMYGEPLLDERLVDLMRYAHKRLPKTTLSIFTNGFYLTIELYNKLVSAGVKEFVISQHTSRMLNNVSEVIEYNRTANDNVHINYRGQLEKATLSNRGGLVTIGNAPSDKQPCRTPSRKLVVNYKGDVLLCCDDYFGKHTFGNIGDENIIDIWRKPAFRKIRKELRNCIWNLDMCRLCRGIKN
jgi:radical SAM protein with 4Fe4S-binding SPASM domain